MKALFYIGIIAIVLGVASLFVALPHNEQHGIQAGDVSLGVTVRHNEKLSPWVSAALILGGAGMMIAGRGKA